MSRLFDKVLIANRGEIACRVIRTCRRLGIATVAVHSTADTHSRHVALADEAVCVGPPPSTDSYLRIDAIVDACLRTKANAVHPGYGFLSENSLFASALASNNIIFVGPDTHSIEAMGDKIQSKILATEAGVTCIPGFRGEIESHEQLLRVAREIRYPVMVKASGGGGGKGMRVAHNDDECVRFFDLCKEEALAAFNNDKMLVEKFIVNPRHIEVQVIADRHGNVVYLPERECSVQRRNQKVIEEAPSMLIDDATRRAMGEQAVAMARKVDYVTAGTVEMVVDPRRNFYFLEMNTRLQVEHPITELITGVDLVEQMLRAAAGQTLSVAQSDVRIHGWATEVRVYAEDPLRNYFPSIGRLWAYQEPEGPGIRVDSGIVEGSAISVYYDPLIAKVSTWGASRDESLQTMAQALDRYTIRGTKNNMQLLQDVIASPQYRAGELTTAILTDLYPNGYQAPPLSEDVSARLRDRAAMMHHARQLALGADPNADAHYAVVLQGDAAPAPCTLRTVAKQPPLTVFKIVRADGSSIVRRLEWPLDALVSWERPDGDEGSLDWPIQFFGSDGGTYHLQHRSNAYAVRVLTHTEAELMPFLPARQETAATNSVKAPMPGVVVAINASVGDTVSAGSVLLTLEAMKMRNRITSERDGKIKAVHVEVGTVVGDGELLIEFDS